MTSIKLNYDDMLDSYLSELDKYKSLSGAEGTVYFVDGKYVIKKYKEKIVKNPSMFEIYIDELQNFKNVYNCNIPKIYASKVVERQENGKTVNDYYILEERVVGHDLYYENLSKFFPYSDLEMEKDEYLKIVNFLGKLDLGLGQNQSFIREHKEEIDIAYEVLMDHIKFSMQTSEQLYELHKENLESFIRSDLLITANARCSSSDMNARNVLFDGKNLVKIDESINMKIEESNGIANASRDVFRDCFDLFLANELSERYSRNFFEINKKYDLKNANKKNMDMIAKVLIKFIKAFEKVAKQPYQEYSNLIPYTILERFLDSENLYKVVSETRQILD